MEKLFFEKSLDTSPQMVWRVLTDPQHLKVWYFDFSDQWSLEIGHVFEWTAGTPDGQIWLHRGMIIEVIPERKLSHTWEYPGYIGRAQLAWEIVPVTQTSTLLRLTFDFLIPFDDRVEALKRENFEEGWHSLMNLELPNYVNQLPKTTDSSSLT